MVKVTSFMATNPEELREGVKLHLEKYPKEYLMAALADIIAVHVAHTAGLVEGTEVHNVVEFVNSNLGFAAAILNTESGTDKPN